MRRVRGSNPLSSTILLFLPYRTASAQYGRSTCHEVDADLALAAEPSRPAVVGASRRQVVGASRRIHPPVLADLRHEGPRRWSAPSGLAQTHVKYTPSLVVGIRKAVDDQDAVCRRPQRTSGCAALAVPSVTGTTCIAHRPGGWRGSCATTAAETRPPRTIATMSFQGPSLWAGVRASRSIWSRETWQLLSYSCGAAMTCPGGPCHRHGRLQVRRVSPGTPRA